jgi:hypothetical protein
MVSTKYLSIFSPATKQERKENFDDYWEFTVHHKVKATGFQPVSFS